MHIMEGRKDDTRQAVVYGCMAGVDVREDWMERYGDWTVLERIDGVIGRVRLG